ncbi:acyl-CoA dehydrogenase family protein [Parafrankia elaeagni]|uniref:acyl-CoA dehydrogenase family protein n=1 Tax=Parafrankia elaeagni TaxID=222534 RepID=UPI00037250CF|nr:acyl-CoA dehydrogenase family protein [Parafrankia elaeagni]
MTATETTEDSADEATLVAEAARDLFTDLCTPESVSAASAAGWDPALWEVLEQSGLTLISVDESAGGSGGTLREAAALLGVAGEFSAPVPVAETCLLGGWLLAAAGLPVPRGPLTAATTDQTNMTVSAEGNDRFRVTGTATRVPGAGLATRVAVLAPAPRSADGEPTAAFGEHPVVLSIDPTACTVVPGANLAGEPRGSLHVDCVIDSADLARGPTDAATSLRHRAALARVVLSAGAAMRALDLTLRYAREREQFGRPIARFQAVQHQVAEMAAEVAALRAAADAAVTQCLLGGFASPQATVAVAAARVTATRSAGVIARIAHQIHGAIGVTEEHPLRLTTMRLWAWRDEAGTEAEWLAGLGNRVIAAGRSGYWPLITSSA